MKKVTMTWLKKMFSLTLALVMLMPMSVYATENVNNFKDIVTQFKTQGTSK